MVCSNASCNYKNVESYQYTECRPMLGLPTKGQCNYPQITVCTERQTHTNTDTEVNYLLPRLRGGYLIGFGSKHTKQNV